jgi:hypothetical protein
VVSFREFPKDSEKSYEPPDLGATGEAKRKTVR